MNNVHISTLAKRPIFYTLKVGWEIVKIKAAAIILLAIILLLLAYASTLFLYFTGLSKDEFLHGFKVGNIVFVINLVSSFLTNLFYFSVATYVGKIFIGVNDTNALHKSITRSGVLKFIFRRMPIALGMMTTLSLILVPLALFVIDIRELNFYTIVIWLVFSYFYFLVQYHMILSSGYLRGLLSVLVLLNPRYLMRSLRLRYIIMYNFYFIIFVLYFGSSDIIEHWNLTYLQGQQVLVGISILFLLFIMVTLPITSVLTSYNEGDEVNC